VRFYQSPADGAPRLVGGLFHYSVLVLPSDAGTRSATIVTSGRDHALRALRDEANFTKPISACPIRAPILDLEPFPGMLAAAGTSDRLRELVTGGVPVATGVPPPKPPAPSAPASGFAASCCYQRSGDNAED
jgi:hypothetical protein